MGDIIPFPNRRPNQPVVLVVDDEYMMRGVLTDILKDCGFTIIAAPSAEAAIECLSRHTHIDVVFSDIKLEGMGSLELAQWIHDNRPGLPVVLAGGYSGKTNMAADLCGAQFLRKPYDFDLIVAQLRETAARGKSRSAQSI